MTKVHWKLRCRAISRLWKTQRVKARCSHGYHWLHFRRNTKSSKFCGEYNLLNEYRKSLKHPIKTNFAYFHWISPKNIFRCCGLDPHHNHHWGSPKNVNNLGRKNRYDFSLCDAKISSEFFYFRSKMKRKSFHWMIFSWRIKPIIRESWHYYQNTIRDL